MKDRRLVAVATILVRLCVGRDEVQIGDGRGMDLFAGAEV